VMYSDQPFSGSLAHCSAAASSGLLNHVHASNMHGHIYVTHCMTKSVSAHSRLPRMAIQPDLHAAQVSTRPRCGRVHRASLLLAKAGLTLSRIDNLEWMRFSTSRVADLRMLVP